MLRIRSIELKNFKNIHTGLHTRHLTIDFSMQKNPMCIIVGDNGKGKTSLLSYLSPFATLGTFDVRDTNKLIIKDEKGYKKIIYDDSEGNEYTIEHFYTPSKDSMSIKSYFQLNGQELNENGNVTSFKRLVSEFLDIEIDYMKLIRIGDNVQNLIRSRATERKVFMGKILDEVDFYLRRYKQMSERERDLKVLISHLTDNMKKLGIDDVSVAEAEVHKITDLISQVSSSIGILEHEKDQTLFKLSEVGFPENGNERIKELEKLVTKNKKILSDLADSHTVESVSNDLDRKKSECATYEGMVAGLEQSYNMLLDSLDAESKNLQTFQMELDKEKENLNLESLEEYATELRKKINETYETKFDELQPACSKEEFEDFMVFLKNTQKFLNMTYEFGKEPIREVLDGMRKEQNILNTITSSLVFIESQKQSERMSLIDRLISRYAGMKITCEQNCPLKNLHKELMEIRDATPKRSVAHDAEFYQMMKLAYENLHQIFDEIGMHKDLIQRLPEKLRSRFTTDALFHAIGNTSNIFEEEDLNEYLRYLTDLHNYRSLCEELSNLELQIKETKAISKIDFFTTQITSSTEKISDLREKISETREKMDQYTDDIQSAKEMIDDLTDTLHALEEYEGQCEELQKLSDQKSSYDQIASDAADIDKQIKEQRLLHSDLIRTKYTKEQNLILYKKLWDEIVEKSRECEDYGYLKYAYSNKNGIPLYFIESFLNGIRGIANEILDIIYDGNLRLEKFHIDADNFDIPYKKGDTVIEDVSLSSQGEQSYINMALSTALHAKRVTKYTISSFDEVDSTFDDDKRQKFIPVMEKIIEINHTSQAFVITHNMMYQQYPVDIIDLNHPEKSTVKMTLE